MVNNKGSQMVLPPPVQVGIMVRNLKEAMDFYSKAFGIGPIQEWDFDISQNWIKGKLTPFRGRSGIWQWGPLQLELMEAAENILDQTFLEKKGEGIHHLQFHVDNLDKWVNHLKDLGMEVTLEMNLDVQFSKSRVAHFVSNRTGTVIFELVEAKQKDKIKVKC